MPGKGLGAEIQATTGRREYARRESNQCRGRLRVQSCQNMCRELRALKAVGIVPSYLCAERGAIIDRSGRLLAGTVEVSRSRVALLLH